MGSYLQNAVLRKLDNDLILRYLTYRFFLFFTIIYPRGIGPTHELYSSSRRNAVVPLLKIFSYFYGGIIQKDKVEINFIG